MTVPAARRHTRLLGLARADAGGNAINPKRDFSVGSLILSLLAALGFPRISFSRQHELSVGAHARDVLEGEAVLAHEVLLALPAVGEAAAAARAAVRERARVRARVAALRGVACIIYSHCAYLALYLRRLFCYVSERGLIAHARFARTFQIIFIACDDSGAMRRPRHVEIFLGNCLTETQTEHGRQS